MPDVENDHIAGTSDHARAGVTGHGARYVLATSTLAGAVAVFLVLGWFLL